MARELTNDSGKQSSSNSNSQQQSTRENGFIEVRCTCGTVILGGAYYCHNCGRYYDNSKNTTNLSQDIALAARNIVFLPFTLIGVAYEEATDINCSKCGEVIHKRWGAKFCPKCGKKI